MSAGVAQAVVLTGVGTGHVEGGIVDHRMANLSRMALATRYHIQYIFCCSLHTVTLATCI